MTSSLNSLMLRLPFRPSRPAKVKNVVTTVSMAVSSSVSGSAAIRAGGDVLTCPHGADLWEGAGEDRRVRRGQSGPALVATSAWRWHDGEEGAGMESGAGSPSVQVAIGVFIPETPSSLELTI